MDIDISKLSDTELKALAYDLIAKIEHSQAQLQAVNQAIRHRQPLTAPIEGNVLKRAISEREA